MQVSLHKVGERATEPLSGNWTSTGGGIEEAQCIWPFYHAGHCEQGWGNQIW